VKKIRIVSPAKAIDSRQIDFALGYLKSRGFEVSIGAHAKGEHHYFSGTKEERRQDMQDALDDNDVDVIICSRGGYGSVQIIDELDYREFLRHPKLIVGYSDITVFHNRMIRMGYFSVHATSPLNFEDNTGEAMESLIKVLEDTENEYKIPNHSLNREGEARERMIGGNLSIICSLIGTEDELKTKNRILFIEEVGEAVYSIDRMMRQLKLAKMLKGLSGLVVGSITEVKESKPPFGKSAEEVIKEAVAEYDFPVCFGFPAGHMNDNRAIILGKDAKLTVSQSGSIFLQ
jgi:muramoyltetrapeptide carboxypeptidase